MKKNKINIKNKIRNILLMISLIGVVGLSIGVIFLKNKSNNIVPEKEEITKKKVNNKIEFDNVKNKLLNWVFGLKTIQDKLNDVLNITKKKEFDKKEEENKFKILKDEFLKVLGEYIDVILRSEENKENKDEHFRIINEFKKLITVEFLKEKIGHIKFKNEGSKPTGIFKTIKEEKEEIYNLFIQYFENLKNEEKKYFLSSKKEGKENELTKLGISKKFKDIFSWFKEPKSYDPKFSQMKNIEQIKLIEDENDFEKITLIKENKEKKQYIVNGILLTGESVKLSETDEQFLERKVKYEFIKYFENNIKNMKKFNLINNFIQNEKFNDELIKKMFGINKENKDKKDGLNFEFKFDEKKTFKNKIFIKILNEFDKDKDNIEKIKRIIKIIKTEVKENINFDVFLNVNISNLSSDIEEIQEVIDLLKQIQEKNKSEERNIGLTGKRGLRGLLGPVGTLGDKGLPGGILDGKLKDLEESALNLSSKIVTVQTEIEKFQKSLKDESSKGTLGRKLKDLEDRKLKINLRASRLELLLNTLIFGLSEARITETNFRLNNKEFVVIYKEPQNLNNDGTWTTPVYMKKLFSIKFNMADYIKNNIVNGIPEKNNSMLVSVWAKEINCYSTPRRNKLLIDKYLEKIYNGTPNESILKLINFNVTT